MLTKEERIAALERVRNDQGGTENRRWKKDQIVEAVTDIRTWLVVLITLMCQSADPVCRCMLADYPFSANIPNGALSNCELLAVSQVQTTH